MKQYCRYCSHLCIGDYCACDVKQECLSEEYCKRVNKCKYFEFNEIDAFNFEKIYKPKEIKEKNYEQLKLEI